MSGIGRAEILARGTIAEQKIFLGAFAANKLRSVASAVNSAIVVSFQLLRDLSHWLCHCSIRHHVTMNLGGNFASDEFVDSRWRAMQPRSMVVAARNLQHVGPAFMRGFGS
jgi:hypothetical protein